MSRNSFLIFIYLFIFSLFFLNSADINISIKCFHLSVCLPTSFSKIFFFGLYVYRALSKRTYCRLHNFFLLNSHYIITTFCKFRDWERCLKNKKMFFLFAKKISGLWVIFDTDFFENIFSRIIIFAFYFG